MTDDLALLKAAVDLATRKGTQHSAVVGDSMRPTFHDGDMITIEPDLASEPSPGDVVVVFGDSSHVFAHRVIHVGRWFNGRGYVLTRGDGLAVVDQPVSLDRIMGGVAVSSTRGQVRGARQRVWMGLVETMAIGSLAIHPVLAQAVVRAARRITHWLPGIRFRLYD